MYDFSNFFVSSSDTIVEEFIEKQMLLIAKD